MISSIIGSIGLHKIKLSTVNKNLPFFLHLQFNRISDACTWPGILEPFNSTVAQNRHKKMLVNGVQYAQ